MKRFWRWVYWRLLDLRYPPSLEELLIERAVLNEEREILLGQIAANERAIKQATLGSGARV